MNVLLLGINYAPELVGIGPYTAGMAEWLVAAGHKVTVICAKPYYPQWKVDPSFKGGGVRVSCENGVRVVRLPIYVPRNPDGTRRVMHHVSFAARAQLAMLLETRKSKPDVVVGIAPSLISMAVARDAARRCGAKFWLHIQDFEVEAAFATGLLKQNSGLGALAGRFENWALEADRVSTISPQMRQKLLQKGVPSTHIVEFRNWVDLDEIEPLQGSSTYRAEWRIERPFVAVYSGNIANKQGIEIVVDAARILSRRKDLIFVICGNGPNKQKLLEQSSGLDNILFHDLQPRDRLSELLGLATVHLLPQIAGAADLVLPSKLINMLASGRPIVATAMPGTGLADEVEGCGIVTQPGVPASFAQAIEDLLDNEELRLASGKNARERAVERWGRPAILGSFERTLSELCQHNIKDGKSVLQ